MNSEGSTNSTACHDAAPGAVHQPADVGGELLRLRAGQQHAVVQRMQEAPRSRRSSGASLDQLVCMIAICPGRAAEADEAELEPEEVVAQCGFRASHRTQVQFDLAPQRGDGVDRPRALRAREEVAGLHLLQLLLQSAQGLEELGLAGLRQALASVLHVLQQLCVGLGPVEQRLECQLLCGITRAQFQQVGIGACFRDGARQLAQRPGGRRRGGQHVNALAQRSRARRLERPPHPHAQAARMGRQRCGEDQPVVHAANVA
jgi:hypothetical protein